MIQDNDKQTASVRNRKPLPGFGKWLTPFRIVLIYALVGGIWIIFSDRLLASFVTDPTDLTRLQTYKGWFFILATAWLLFFLVRHYFANIQQERRNLEKSERYNRALFEQSPIGLALCRMDGQLVDVNPAYAAIIGRTIEETLALNYWDITPRKYAEQEQAQLESLREAGRYGPYEKEYIHKDGYLVPVRLQGLLIERGGEHCIWSSVEDITERIKAENERQLFVSLANNSKEFIGLADPHFIPFYANAAALKLVGLPNLEAVRKIKVQDVFFPEDQPFITNEFLPRVLREGNSEVEIRFRHFQTGEATWMLYNVFAIYDLHGDPAGWATVSRNINERKKTEEELRITNEELLAINRIITTTATGSGVKKILEKVMDEALRITGLEGGTICTLTPDDTLHLAVQRETSEATIIDLTTNEVKVGDCLCGECAKNLKPLILPNKEEVLKFATREATRGENIRFHAAFPLIIGERCLGVLCVFTRTEKKPAERSLKLLETVTAQIAIAVDNAQMFEEISWHAAILENRVKERTAELENRNSELERLNRLFVDRELRMVELKQIIRALEDKLNGPGGRA